MTPVEHTRRSALVAIGIGLLVAAAYLPALQSGFIWDDDQYVTQNVTLRSADGMRRIWLEPGATPQYYPLVYTSFWLEYRLWKLDPLGYHVTNLVLHLLAALLLWRLLLHLQLPGAWLAAGLFAVHPVQVESVAWITERKNVLSAVFYFAAALAYWRFDALREIPTSAEKRHSSRLNTAAAAPTSGRREASARKIPSGPWRWYFSALLLFAAALFSKTVTCSLPAAILLATWWRKGGLRSRDVIPTLPFFALGLSLSLVTVSVEHHTVGASGAEYNLSMFDRGLIAGRAVWFYAAKLLWPVDLTFIYPRWRLDPSIWWQWLFPTAAVAVLVALWLGRKRLGRGPLVAALFFAGTLVPALGFLNVFPMRYSFVADHFQYLACVGLIALFAAQASRLGDAPGAVLLLLLAFLTWQQTHIYRDLETLWRDTLAKNADSWLAWNNLGNILFRRDETDTALQHYERALRLYPESVEVRNNLAAALIAQERWDEALVHAAEAFRIEPAAPGVSLKYSEALNAVATALAERGERAMAIERYQRAIEVRPDFVEALNNLAAAQLQQGHWDDALVTLQRAYALEPTSSVILNNYGSALLQKGEVDSAIERFRAALNLDPDDPQILSNLGAALSAKKAWAQARGYYERSLAIDPDNRTAQFNLEMALAHEHLGQGRRDEAMQHASEAQRLDPSDAQARELLQSLAQ